MEKIKQSSYEILNIPFNASAREIKSSYKKMIRQYTPEHDPENFMKIREAYEYFTEEKPFELKQVFPVYKKPFLVINKKNNTQKGTSIVPIETLSTVFETPFNLEKDIKAALKNSRKEMAFGNKQKAE